MRNSRATSVVDSTRPFNPLSGLDYPDAYPRSPDPVSAALPSSPLNLHSRVSTPLSGNPSAISSLKKGSRGNSRGVGSSERGLGLARSVSIPRSVDPQFSPADNLLGDLQSYMMQSSMRGDADGRHNYSNMSSHSGSLHNMPAHIVVDDDFVMAPERGGGGSGGYGSGSMSTNGIPPSPVKSNMSLESR